MVALPQLSMPIRYRTLPLVVALGGPLLGACDSTTTTPTSVAFVEIRPSESRLIEGETVQLQARLEDAAGNLLSGRSVSWSSNPSSVASVDPNGLLRALAPGSAVITAVSEGVQGTATVSVQGRAFIVLERSDVSFETTRDDEDPTPQRIRISNNGESALVGLTTTVTYLDGSTGWLASGLSSTQAPADLTVAASVVGLAAGTYRARVDVRSAAASNSPVPIQVTFRVIEPPPAIGLSSDRVELQAPETSITPVPASLVVTNVGGGILAGITAAVEYGPGQPEGWLAVAPADDTAPTVVEIAATAGALAPGDYTATVFVAADGAVNSPQSAAVLFTVVPRGAGAPPSPSGEGFSSGR